MDSAPPPSARATLRPRQRAGTAHSLRATVPPTKSRREEATPPLQGPEPADLQPCPASTTLLPPFRSEQFRRRAAKRRSAAAAKYLLCRRRLMLRRRAR